MHEHSSPARHPAAPPLGFANGQVEALKWLALASMFTDHVGRFLLGHPEDGWVFAAGRLAFPLFALVLGLNLARAGDAGTRSGRTALRLALWCGLSVLPSVWARGEPQMVNVLGTLALGAALVWVLASSGTLLPRLGVALAAAGAAQWVEFGAAGVFLVVAAYLAASTRQPSHALLAAALLLVTAAQNGSFGGLPAFAVTLAALPVAAAARVLPLHAPRLQHFFYAVYPLHLALIGAWRQYAA